MLSNADYQNAKQNALKMLTEAGIVVTAAEAESLEVADFGLDRLKELGLELVIYVNTERCCAKELVMFPGQICPEHRHPPVDGALGKEETFRCRWGEVYLYVPGEAAVTALASIPEDKKGAFTVWHEIILKPGDQYTLSPDTLHWFQSGPQGAIVSEFSTTSRDELDIFTDPQIIRSTKIV